ncbi:HDL051Wp [Eremothecium sinecaudum]|uniref:HDL051Wp n=1 Tax=Eremothecium sinecaudum TaxID=45286 RepID=A0A0X8HSP6_9SACH|nr:HDL051Wp [Eremothecium sinecaudum]AMD20693.1 HDL051Wp [Eremothecium sinecaudum]
MLFFETLRQKASQIPFLDKISENFLSTLSRDEKFRLKYKLPEEENLLNDISVDISVITGYNLSSEAEAAAENRTSTYVYSGRLFLTDHYLVFRDSVNNDSCRFTLNISTIKKVERAQNNSLLFSLNVVLYEGTRMVIQFIGSRYKSEEFSLMLKTKLKQNIQNTKRLHDFVKGFYSDYLISKNVLKNGDAEPPAGGLGQIFKYPGDHIAQKEKAKLRLWFEYFRDNGINLSLVRQPMFNKLVRVGIPNRLRGEIWELCAGSMYLRFAHQDEYQKILEDNKGKNSKAIEEIEKDLCRSLPEYSGYQDDEGILRLRNVLVSYSWKNPDVGYCQAMNIVVAALLIFMTEEQAFWCLTRLCDTYIPGYYSKTMYGTLLDQRVFESLVESKMPLLWAHITTHDIQLSTVSLPWFLSLFFTSMPLTFAFRIMDLFFHSGPKCLFQVALAVLKINGEDLLEVDDDGMFIAILKNYFQTLDQPAHPESTDIKYQQFTKFQELLVVAFKEFNVITEDLVELERSKHKSTIFQNIESFAKRTQLRNLPPVRNLTPENISNIYDIYYQSIETHKISMGVGSSKMNLNAFGLFLAKFCDWCKPIEGDDKPIYQNQKQAFIKRLFDRWDFTSSGELTLSDVVVGIDKLVSKDLMEMVNTFFELFDDRKTGQIQREEILQMSEALLFLTKPWEIGKFADFITQQTIENDIAENIASRSDLNFNEDVAIPKGVVIDDQKYKQMQLERYLEAASSFLKRCFEYARPLEIDDSIDLIDVNDSVTEERDEMEAKELESIKANAALNPETPRIIDLPTFRMIILANETYELLFSSTLRKSIHLDEEVNAFDDKVKALRNVFDGLIADGRRVAHQVRRRVDSVTTKTNASINSNDKQDDLADFSAEQTSDHADILADDLLDLGIDNGNTQHQRQKVDMLNVSSHNTDSKDLNLIEFEA